MTSCSGSASDQQRPIASSGIRLWPCTVGRNGRNARRDKRAMPGEGDRSAETRDDDVQSRLRSMLGCTLSCTVQAQVKSAQTSKRPLELESEGGCGSSAASAQAATTSSLSASLKIGGISWGICSNSGSVQYSTGCLNSPLASLAEFTGLKRPGHATGRRRDLRATGTTGDLTAARQPG
jgi:hypothetical protein